MSTTSDSPTDPDAEPMPELKIVTALRPFSFEQRPIPIQGEQPGELLAIEPLHGHPTDVIAADHRNSLYRIDLRSGRSTRLITLTPEQLRADGTLSLVLSRDHAFAAVTRCGKTADGNPFNAGQVVDMQSGLCVFALSCGNYHVEHTPFPVTFVEHEGRTLLIHATNWNRMDISDPRTGQCLTERATQEGAESDDPPSDYVFTEWHGELRLSPDQSRVVTIGWVWHPVGVAFSWSVRDWLKGNAWEADHGPSKRSYASWPYFWSSPFFWSDDRTLCIWGDPEKFDEEKDLPLNSVVFYDAETEEVLRTFDGPTMDGLYFDKYLFSGIEGGVGISIWDLEAGTLLHKQPGIRVRAYHPGLRAFLEIDGADWSVWHWHEG